MDRLSELMGFSYRLHLVEDGQFGGENDDGSWTGLVGDLINRVSNRTYTEVYKYILCCFMNFQKAEIALAPLIITSNRESVIDFTKAFYDLGLQGLYNANDNGDKFSEFIFLKPFNTNLWLLILASTIVVSVGVAIIGRLSPYDWYQSPPDDYRLWESRFQMTLFNSVWQSLSAVLHQGTYPS